MKRWIVRTALALAGLVVLLLGYGTLVEPRLVLDQERSRVALPHLGEELAGTRVAVLADLQVGMWFANTGMAARAVREIVEDEPDVVLLAGDFVYGRSPDVPRQVQTVLGLLEPLLASGIPAYAVLGNHDYAVDGADELRRALEGEGVTVLRNESVAVPLGGVRGDERLHVVGLGPDSPQDRVDVAAALDAVPAGAPRVVLMHNPTVFDRLPAGSAPLSVAGHTHCGQISLPFTPRWSYVGLSAEERVVVDGWAPPEVGAEGNRLFVTCGIGFSLVPVRIGAPPQIAFFDLQPA